MLPSGELGQYIDTVGYNQRSIDIMSHGRAPNFDWNESQSQIAYSWLEEYAGMKRRDCGGLG